MKKSGKILLGIGGGLLVATGAQAHISIASTPGTANVTQEVTFGVGHGCDGKDTVKVTIDIPAGVTSVRPMRSDFGNVSLTKNGTVVTGVTWEKTDPLAQGDIAYYKLVIRLKPPNTPFTQVVFPAHQTCKDAQGNLTVVDWTAAPGTDAGTAEEAPVLQVMPARVAGWNKYTLPADVKDLKVFNDALIVWKGNAAYSGNANTLAQIKAEAGVTELKELKSGDEIWVKY